MSDCPVCSCEVVAPMQVKIHDYRKYVCAPSPCPNCFERMLETVQKAGEAAGIEIETRALNAISDDSGVWCGWTIEELNAGLNTPNVVIIRDVKGSIVAHVCDRKNAELITQAVECYLTPSEST